MVSCDVYRPAAIEQLRTLAGEVEVLFHPRKPDRIRWRSQSALDAAKSFYVLISIPPAACVDAAMMEEIKALHGSSSRSRRCSSSTR